MSGCTQVKESFGLGHYQADEFCVDPNPPLELPPEYNLPKPVTQSAPHTPKSPASLQPDLLSSHSNVAEQKAFLNLKKDKMIEKNIREMVNQEAQKEEKKAAKDDLKKYKGSFVDTFKRNLTSISSD